MTAFTDRADAVEAAIRDLARDLESDLAKLGRHRGTTASADNGIRFRDPGPDLETYTKQKSDHPGSPRQTVERYRAAIGEARHAIPSDAATTQERARQHELHTLIDHLAAVTNHDEASALVATFEQE